MPEREGRVPLPAWHLRLRWCLSFRNEKVDEDPVVGFCSTSRHPFLREGETDTQVSHCSGADLVSSLIVYGC